ncbi:hypothetical protein ES708_11663 [subsurface metagenome]
MQLLRLLSKVEQDEIKERFIQSAFIGWQMGAGSGKKFGEYLGEIGLSEKQAVAEATPEDRKLAAKAAIAKAEEILAMASNKDKA